RNELLQQRFVGKFDGVLFFAGGAFLKVFEVGRDAEQALPVLVGLGGALPEFLDLFGGERARLGGRGNVGRIHRGQVIGRLFNTYIRFLHWIKLPVPNSERR